jgi:hypothetical protein
MSIVIDKVKINKKVKRIMKERVRYISEKLNGKEYEILFLTITFSDNKQYMEYKEKYHNMIVSNWVKNYGVVAYVRSDEIQKRGVGHVHFLIYKKKGKRIGFLDEKYKGVVGITNIKRIDNKNVDGVVGYIMKYLTKSIENNWSEFKRKNGIRKKIRRYSIYYKGRKEKEYKKIGKNRIIKSCIEKGIDYKKENGYWIIEKENKRIEYRWIVDKYSEKYNDVFEIWIEKFWFRFYYDNQVIYNEIEIENENDLKEVVELVLNLMDLN